MRSVLSALLFLHGLVHAVGFIGPLEMVSEAPFQTTLLGKTVPNASAAGRSLAILWLLLTLAFSVASVAVFLHASWWFPYTVALLLASLALCFTAWPAAKTGAAINAVLLLMCALMERAQLWSDLLGLLRVWSF